MKIKQKLLYLPSLQEFKEMYYATNGLNNAGEEAWDAAKKIVVELYERLEKESFQNYNLTFE